MKNKQELKPPRVGADGKVTLKMLYCDEAQGTVRVTKIALDCHGGDPQRLLAFWCKNGAKVTFHPHNCKPYDVPAKHLTLLG